jgi:hypothetical protein
VPVATLASHHIRNAKRLQKASQLLDQVNHPMVQVVENAMAVIALVAIDLVQIDAVIDKYFSAHYIRYDSSIKILIERR